MYLKSIDLFKCLEKQEGGDIRVKVLGCLHEIEAILIDHKSNIITLSCDKTDASIMYKDERSK